MSEFCPGEPFFVSLTERIAAVARSRELPPDEILALAEEHHLAAMRGEDDPDDDETEARRAAAAAKLAELVEAADLPDVERFMLAARASGDSQRQIAARLGIQQPSVHNRLHRALNDVRAAARGDPRRRRRGKPQCDVPGAAPTDPSPIPRNEPTMQTATTTSSAPSAHANGAAKPAKPSQPVDIEALMRRADELLEQAAEADRALADALRARLADLDAERATLVAALEQRATPRKAAPRGAAEAVLAALSTAGAKGLAMADILQATRLPHSRARRALDSLGKRVRRVGRSRGRRYFAA